VKIRSITIGFNVALPSVARRVKRLGVFLNRARQSFEEKGYEVQTTRITSQPWTQYLSGVRKRKIIGSVQILEDCCRQNSIDFCSIGTACDPEQIKFTAMILKSTEIVSGTATITGIRGGIDYHATQAAAGTIMRIAEESDQGETNFRFAALANCPPDIPFYPASYHRGRTCFMIALESGDILQNTLTKNLDLMVAQQNLNTAMFVEYSKIERIARQIEKEQGILFKGIDTSPAPSLQRRGSVALAIERILHDRFGAPGTLAVAGMITGVLRLIKIRRCGFSGLMLPVMEDFGLARRIGNLNIDTLLACSAICGTGLDCVPLPGNIGHKRIVQILRDIATLALKLNKPLSARLLPMPGRVAGDMTRIDSPYLINCQIPRIL
jgi:uncharacterized protein (UPF0210 family)